MTAINNKDLYLAFGTEVLNTDFRTFQWSEAQDQIDATAGGDTVEESLPGDLHYRCSVDVVIQADANEGSYVCGQESSIEIGREGTGTGKNKLSATTARVETFAQRQPRGDVGIWSIAWRISGDIVRGTY